MRNILLRDIIMNKKEIDQVKILERLKNREISQKLAADSLEISVRQVRNKLKRYKREGAKGIIHRNFGQPSRNKISEKIK